MLGALYRYLREADPRHFQPMNANFGLLDELPDSRARQAAEARAFAERALRDLACRGASAAVAGDAAHRGAVQRGDACGHRSVMRPCHGRASSQHFLAHLEKERDVSPHTVTAYGRDLEEFARFLAELLRRTGVDLAGRGPARHARLHGAPRRAAASASARSRAHCLRCAASTGTCTDGDRGRQSRRVRSVRRGASGICRRIWTARRPTRLFEAAESAAATGGFAAVRNLAMLELFYSTGMRLSELRGLNRRDLDLVCAAGQGARQRTQRAHRARRRPCHSRAAHVRWHARDARRRRWARGPTAWPCFSTQRGQRLSVRGVQAAITRCWRESTKPRSERPLAAPHVRDAPARRGRRSARRAGAARPRVGGHHADLHAHERRPAQAGVSQGASAGDVMAGPGQLGRRLHRSKGMERRTARHAIIQIARRPVRPRRRRAAAGLGHGSAPGAVSAVRPHRRHGPGDRHHQGDRAAQPTVTVDVLASVANAAVLRGNPHVGTVLTIDRKRARGAISRTLRHGAARAVRCGRRRNGDGAVADDHVAHVGERRAPPHRRGGARQ